MRIGYFLSCEESRPADLVEQARLAEQAGFDALWISDHYHPWNDEQGQSPFVWSVIGALPQVDVASGDHGGDLPDGAHPPGVIAQAAATAAVMLPGGFRLGVGSGEALNEHITGDRWPTRGRCGWTCWRRPSRSSARCGPASRSHHHGEHYTVEDARIYTLPDTPPPIYVSGFGPKAVDLAGRIGDGFVCTKPDADLVDPVPGERRRRQAGAGRAQGLLGARTGQSAIDTAYRLWRNAGVPGELSQVLPSPQHFEQAAELVTRR